MRVLSCRGGPVVTQADSGARAASTRVVARSPRGGTSPNPPRAGRQQGQVSSVRCAGAPSRSAPKPGAQPASENVRGSP